MTLKQACPLEYQRAQCAFKDSMLHGSCNSHYVSQFAAFFIDARTKRSVVESFDYCNNKSSLTVNKKFGLVITSGGRIAPATKEICSIKNTCGAIKQISNDPSAGSPTETLLRLLLPLNDQV